MHSLFISDLALGRRSALRTLGEPGKNSLTRIDIWKTFAQDVQPETPGYAWSKTPIDPAFAPPTGLASVIYK